MNKKTVRMFERTTNRHWLSIEDALNIGKLRFFVGQYANGKAQSYIGHYIDVPAALYLMLRLIFSPVGLTYKEYKGSTKKDGVISRVMEIKVKQGRKDYVVYWDFSEGLGKKTATGAIKPAGSPLVSISMGMPLQDAQVMAASVWTQIQASFALRAWLNRENGLQTQPLLFAPTAPEKQTAVSEIEQLFSKQELLYEDKTSVDIHNQHEVEAYKIFEKENRRHPNSRAELREFAKKQIPIKK